MTINIDQTISDLQTYAKSLDQNGNFAVLVNRAWKTPVLISVRPDVDLEQCLSRKLNSQGVDFVEVNSVVHGPNIYSKTLNPPKPEEPKPKYKQIILDSVTYDLVPVV